MPMAMARPRTPGGEIVAIRAAAANLPANLSGRAKAATIARRVVAAYLRDEARTDPFERLLYHAEQRLDPDPVEAIATAEGGNVAAIFVAERLARYEGRCCRQLSHEGWEAETREVAKIVEDRLARRFREYCS
jgi:hypothetical protein